MTGTSRKYRLVREEHVARGPLTDNGYSAPVTFEFAIRRASDELVFRFERGVDAVAAMEALEPGSTNSRPVARAHDQEVA